MISFMSYLEYSNHTGKGQWFQGLGGGRTESFHFTVKEFQLGKMEGALEMDDGDGYINSINVLNSTELYT